MPSSDDRSEAKGAEDIVNADESAWGDELALKQEVEFSSDMCGVMVVVEEDEVELGTIVVAQVFDRVDVEHRHAGIL